MADKATRTNPGPIDGSSYYAGNVTLGPNGSSEATMIHALRSALMLSNPSVRTAWAFYVDRRPDSVFKTEAEIEGDAVERTAANVEEANRDAVWFAGFNFAREILDMVGIDKASEMQPDDAPESFSNGFAYAIETALSVREEHDNLEAAMTDSEASADGTGEGT